MKKPLRRVEIKRLPKRTRDFLVRLQSPQYVYFLAALVFVAGLAITGWFGFHFYSGKSVQAEDITVTSTPSGTTDCDFRRQLDGMCVGSEAEVSPPLVGVMIENSSDAWPLAGLAAASVVYEAPAEGDIPRFLALYADTTTAQKVGPVRSARPYFIDWISEYPGAMYMHVGGSPDALERLSTYEDILNIDEFTRSWYFWRSAERSMPHNTYTSSQLWQRARTAYPTTATSTWQGWQFTNGVACTENCTSEVTIPFGAARYDATWEYSSNTQRYTRLQNHLRQRDDNGTEILADTVIVQYVRAQVIDEIGRKQLDTIGQGNAVIFRDGHSIDARWRKRGRTSRTEWLDPTGDPIPLKPGKIWIEIVPQTVHLRSE